MTENEKVNAELERQEADEMKAQYLPKLGPVYRDLYAVSSCHAVKNRALIRALMAERAGKRVGCRYCEADMTMSIRDSFHWNGNPDGPACEGKSGAEAIAAFTAPEGK